MAWDFDFEPDRFKPPLEPGETDAEYVRRVSARFEEEVQRFFEGLAIGQHAPAPEAVLEQVRLYLSDGLRARAVPEEWWEGLLELVEVGEADDGSPFLEIDVPGPVRRWMRRPVIRYDPGVPPV